jgi:hypothetical protein
MQLNLKALSLTLGIFTAASILLVGIVNLYRQTDVLSTLVIWISALIHYFEAGFDIWGVSCELINEKIDELLVKENINMRGRHMFCPNAGVKVRVVAADTLEAAIHSDLSQYA